MIMPNIEITTLERDDGLAVNQPCPVVLGAQLQTHQLQAFIAETTGFILAGRNGVVCSSPQNLSNLPLKTAHTCNPTISLVG